MQRSVGEERGEEERQGGGGDGGGVRAGSPFLKRERGEKRERERTWPHQPLTWWGRKEE